MQKQGCIPKMKYLKIFNVAKHPPTLWGGEGEGGVKKFCA